MANAKNKAEKTEVEEEKVTATEPSVTPEETIKEKDAGAEGQDQSMVEVSKDDLKKFMTRLDGLEKDYKRLIEASDKARMASISERERGDRKELPVVRLSRIGRDGKLVIAWQTTANESYISNNRAVTNQAIEVFFEDGSSENMPLLDFYRKQNKESKGEIISRTDDSEGKTTLKVRMMSDGQEIEIPLKFVN